MIKLSFRFRPLLFIIACALFCSLPLQAHKVILQGNGKLSIIEKGEVEWEMKWGGIHDIHVLKNGNIMVQEGRQKVVEIDRKTKKVIWSYDSSTSEENKGKKIEVHAFQPLENGHIMIAESGAGRIIEIDRDGKIHKQIELTLDKPHPHKDTRLARKLSNGNYLVCHEGDGAVREYDEFGIIVWEYRIPMFGKEKKGGHGLDAFGNSVFGAIRLDNGSTLIATGNGHSVLEVDHDKKIVWKLTQDELKAEGIRFAWITTLEVLPNGNYVIGNCHAGDGNPLLVEIDPKTKKVIWTLDEFKRYGNAVSNSQILSDDLFGKTNR